MAYNDFEELAKIAYKGEELSDFAPLPTKYMYLRLSVLYDCFAKGRYSKEQCVKLKNELRQEYRKIMQDHERDMECYREYLNNRRVNTELIIKIEKSTNKNDILDACLKIVGNCLNDKSFYERNRSKGTQLDF
jgi:hypothetical protein